MSVKKKELNRCFFVSSLFLIFLVFITLTVSGQTRVAEIKNTNRVEGCSCAFQTLTEARKRNSQKFIFLSELGTQEGWMNISGRDTRLKLIKTTENTNPKVRVKAGDRFYEEYTAPQIKVRLDYRIKRLCPPLDEACEWIEYDVTITVRKGTSSQTLKTTGGCGC